MTADKQDNKADTKVDTKDNSKTDSKHENKAEIKNEIKEVVKESSGEPDRYHEAPAHAHLANDSKDSRSIANRLAREEQRKEKPDDPEVQMLKEDPTLPARSHGNKPSRGAEIDAEIMREEQEELERKGKA